MEKGLEMARTSKGVQIQLEVQIKSTSSLSRSPGAVCAKTDALVAYGLGFGYSADAQKAKKINLSKFVQSHNESSKQVDIHNLCKC